MSIALNQEIDRAAAVLGKSRDGFPDVVTAVSALTTTLFDSIDRPPADPSAPRQALEGVSRAWRAALEAEFGGQLPAATAELVTQQRFVDAATAIAAAMRGESDAVSSRRLALALRPMVVSDDPAVAVVMFNTELAQAASPAPLQALLARTRAQLAAAKLWQTVLVALLAMILGYGLFAPKFVGDYQDSVMIFFWAFGLGLTADSTANLDPTSRK